MQHPSDRYWAIADFAELPPDVSTINVKWKCGLKDGGHQAAGTAGRAREQVGKRTVELVAQAEERVALAEGGLGDVRRLLGHGLDRVWV